MPGFIPGVINKEGHKMMTYEEFLTDLIEDLTSEELLQLHNEWASETGCYDQYIYENNEYSLNELFSSKIELIRAIQYGEYSINDEYFSIDVYGNLESYRTLLVALDSLADIDLLVEWSQDKEYKKDAYIEYLEEVR